MQALEHRAFVALHSSPEETHSSSFPHKCEKGKQKWLSHQAAAPKETIHSSISQLLPTQTDREKVCRLGSQSTLSETSETSQGNVSVQHTSLSLPMKFMLPTARQNFSVYAPNFYHREIGC